MPGVKRVQLDGWGGHSAGKVICVDSRSASNYYTGPVVQQRVSNKQFGAPYMPPKEDAKYKSLYGQQFQQPVANGVDQVQVEIAKACNLISKQVATLPISIRECSVCLSSNAHTQMVPCGHVFHSRCFLRWFRSNRSCPLCRTSVDRVQLAPTPQDNETSNNVDAIMEEDDEDEDENMGVESSNAELMHDDDLIDFLSHTKTDDIDLLPLEDMEVLEEMTMDTSMDLHVSHHSHHHHHQQYIPQTTMPNYWMVLNNGQTLAQPQSTPTRPPPTPSSQPPRMVHIAPRPNMAQMHRPASTLMASPAKSNPVTPLRDLKMNPSMVMPTSQKTNSCRCAGGCRNGRCACVKEGSMCGVTCRCTSCKNPFLSIAMAGIDVSTLVRDDCFMHNLSKIRDMMTKLHEIIPVPCCPTSTGNQNVSILNCIDGFQCGNCNKSYDFSWCSNKLCDREKQKRNHCSKCKRCGDHRDVHCDNCGRCYFAGVSSSFACPCQEKAAIPVASKDDGAGKGEDEEEGCVIM